MPKIRILSLCTIALLLASTTFAQMGPPDGGFGPDGPGGGQGGPGGGRGGRGRRGGPGGFQGDFQGGPGGGFQGSVQNNYAEIQSLLFSTDEEWKVIGPLIQKVISARQMVDAPLNATISNSTGFGPPGNDGFNGPADVAGGNFGPGGQGGRGGRGGPGGGGNDPFGGPADTAGGNRGGPGGGRGFRGGGGGAGGAGGGPSFGDFQNAQDQSAVGTNTPTATAPAAASNATKNQIVTVTQALTDLRTTLADPNATNDQLKDGMSVVRAARQKARKELDSAEKKLLEILTVDQQAELAGIGIID